jgi:hypothetical protein
LGLPWQDSKKHDAHISTMPMSVKKGVLIMNGETI